MKELTSCIGFDQYNSLRQFGLELVAAGSLFCEVSQLRHGLRCLRTAYSLYEV